MADERLLVIHQGALGDFVLTFPALAGLRERFARIDVLTSAGHGRLAVAVGLADGYFPLEAAAFATLFGGEPAAPVRELFSSFHDILILSFSRDLESTIRGIAGGRVFRIAPRPRPDLRIHVADYLLAHLHGRGLIRHTGAGIGSGVLPKGYPPPTARSAQPFALLIHPGAGSRKKMWPLGQFMQVGRCLDARGWGVHVLVGPAERHLIKALAAPAAFCPELHTPRDLGALLALLQTMSGFVGNDSGVSHLAAFCGCATVAIFGPSDPLRWRPIGPAVEAVCPQTGEPPCFETDPENCPAEQVLARISPAMVMAAFDRALAKRMAAR